jgi:excisionase family DNA binding protein
LEEGRFISLAEAAAQFGISHSHLKLLARTGKLRATKIGNSWVTTPEAVAAYVKDESLRRRGRRPNPRS